MAPNLAILKSKAHYLKRRMPMKEMMAATIFRGKLDVSFKNMAARTTVKMVAVWVIGIKEEIVPPTW